MFNRDSNKTQGDTLHITFNDNTYTVSKAGRELCTIPADHMEGLKSFFSDFQHTEIVCNVNLLPRLARFAGERKVEIIKANGNMLAYILPK